MHYLSRKKKEQRSTGRLKKMQKSIDRINRVYPIIGCTEEGYVKTKIGLREGFFEVLDVKHYDTNILDEKQFNFVAGTYWRMQQLFSGSLKEVHMNLPEDNQAQQEYIKYKLQRTTDVVRIKVLDSELKKLKFIEKTYKSRRTYLIVFGRTTEELSKNIEDLNQFRKLFRTATNLYRKKD